MYLINLSPWLVVGLGIQIPARFRISELHIEIEGRGVHCHFRRLVGLLS